LKMWDGTDETFKVYFDLMQKWSDNVSANDDVITRRALKIYAALIKARDRMTVPDYSVPLLPELSVPVFRTKLYQFQH